MKSLSGAERMAHAAPRDKSSGSASAVASGSGGGGGGGNVYKVFAATGVPAPAASRGVRRFAGGGGGGGASRTGSGNTSSSMVAPTGWWVWFQR